MTAFMASAASLNISGIKCPRRLQDAYDGLHCQADGAVAKDVHHRSRRNILFASKNVERNAEGRGIDVASTYLWPATDDSYG